MTVRAPVAEAAVSALQRALTSDSGVRVRDVGLELNEKSRWFLL